MLSQQKGTLSFVICFVLGIHALAIFYCHNHAMHKHLRLEHALSYFEDEAFDLLQRKERTLLLGQIFDRVTELTPEIKEQLHELRAEFSPTASITFPEGEPFLVSDETFTLEKDPLDFVSQQNERQLAWESDSLLDTPALAVSNDLPMLTDFIRDYETYDGLGIVAGSDHFDVQIEYAEKRNRPGYVFKLSFIPRQDIIFKRIQQNYYFLLDRSNSIPRARFTLNKQAVSAALEHMKPKDTFNILIFDDKVCRLSETTLTWNTANVAKARAFLDSQGHGGYFAATELYSSLGKIIPDNVSDTEVNTAILLSDGDTYLPQEKQRQTIGGWTTNNMGKVSLYAIASGGGNNLPLLELISSFNKGNLIYSYDHTQLNSRITKLVQTIRNPIGKQMVATAVPTDKQAVVILQPKNNRLPDLYQNTPFVLYGSTNRLTDFVVFLQGKYYDNRFDIKKHVSFETATRGSPSLEKVWTQLVVQEFYERFFEDGNKKHLDAAKHLLSPLNLPVPFHQ